MRKIVLTAGMVTLIAVAVVWAQTTVNPRPLVPSSSWMAFITNWPAVQTVSGAVSVDNLPPVQSVEVVNWPEPGGAERFHLVGFTTATMNGGSGVFAFTRACQVEFPGSRMCTITEATRITAIPDLSGGTYLAWADTDTPTVSGENCGGWGEGTLGYRGLVISNLGQRYIVNCDASFSVACCAPAE